MEQFHIIASNNITLDLAYPNCEDPKNESLLVWNCPFLGVPIRHIAEIKSTWSVIHPLKTMHSKQKPEQHVLTHTFGITEEVSYALFHQSCTPPCL